jgi:dolichyl-phosphate-mannose--protein O-mannosyl transferase
VSWSRLDTAALVVVSAGAAVLRLTGLDRPAGLVFDEIFYARDACWYVFGTESVCGIADLASRSHPPLGKWLIGSGIALFGYTETEPFSYRIAAAIAGIATVILLYLLAWRLLRTVAPGRVATVGALAASGLLATDFLHLVQSRVGMLDVFIVLFVVLAVLAVVLDRDRLRPTQRPTLLDRVTFGHPWRLVAGAALGAATATKWSGGYVALALVALTVVWEVARARREQPEATRGASVWRAVRREAVPTIVLLGLVPLAVYLASYTGRMPGALLALPWQEGSVSRGIWEHQRAMLDFHTSLGGHHPYESPAWSWGALKRPVAYFFTDESGAYREILALGSPFAWWPGFAAVLLSGALWVRWRADVWGPEIVIVVAALATYGPWLVLSGSRSQTFIWYLLPTMPFVFLALGLVAARLWLGLLGRVAVVGFAAVVLAGFLFFYPVLVALPQSPDAWWQRIWFRSCDRPDGPALVLPDDEINQGQPPDGWCWI